MTQRIIVWGVIAGGLLCAFLLRAAAHCYARYRHQRHRPKQIFEVGDEKEIFYIPGDIIGQQDMEDI